MTSPVLINRAARATRAGVIRFAAPRSSAAPHFDGQRSASVGGRQPCAFAGSAASARIASRANAMIARAMLTPGVATLELVLHLYVEDPRKHAPRDDAEVR